MSILKIAMLAAFERQFESWIHTRDYCSGSGCCFCCCIRRVFAVVRIQASHSSRRGPDRLDRLNLPLPSEVFVSSVYVEPEIVPGIVPERVTTESGFPRAL